MRFRPANISLINRRLYLPRLLLTLPSIETDDQRILTGHYISMSGLPTIHQQFEKRSPSTGWISVSGLGLTTANLCAISQNSILA